MSLDGKKLNFGVWGLNSLEIKVRGKMFMEWD
jgi:hypothetical protein